MTQVERDGSGFVVPATLLAEAFKIDRRQDTAGHAGR